MGKKRSPRHPVQEKNQLGCMGGFVSIFDFQNGRSTRKLLSDSRLSSRPAADHGTSRRKRDPVVGSESCDFLFPLAQDNERRATGTARADKSPSVKNLLQEVISSEQDPKKQIINAEVEANQSSSERGGQARKMKKRSNKISKRSRNVHTHSFSDTEHLGSESSCQQNLEKESALDVNAILEEFFCQIQVNDSFSVNKDQYDELSLQSKQQCSVSEEKLSEATEVFITQKFLTSKHLTSDERTLDATEFVDALKTLTSNKALLLKLLKDPDSPLVKHIQRLLNLHPEKDENFKPLERPKLSGQELCSSRSPDAVNRMKHHLFRRKKNKLHGENPPSPDASAQHSNKIVILKPGSAGLQTSKNETDLASSLQSHHIMRDRGPNDRAASPFSLTEIRRRFRRAVRKERHSISSDNHNLEDSALMIGGHSGRNSPNRDHFFNERFPKSPIRIKNVEKVGAPKDYIEPVTSGIHERKVSNIYIEGKKHLSEMLSNGDDNHELSSRHNLEPLGRILSLTGYNFSSARSPGRDSTDGLLGPQRDDCGPQKSKMTEEIEWIKRDTGSCSDESISDKVNDDNEVERTSCSSGIEMHSEVHVEIAETSTPIPKLSSVIEGFSVPSSSSLVAITGEEEATGLHQNISDMDAHVDEERHILSLGSEMLPEVDIEIIEVINSAVNEEIYSLDGISEQSSSYNDTAELCDEVSCKSLRLESTEENASSPPASPSSPLTTEKGVDLETVIDRQEQPSPVSVLDPLFADDAISPGRSIVELPMQPLESEFEDQNSCAHGENNHLKICMVDNESKYEYVKAVLEASGLSWDGILMQQNTSGQFLDSSLFQEVELSPYHQCLEQKALFDCTDEVLVEVFDRYLACSPWVSFVKSTIRPVPKAKSIISEVWDGIEWHLRPVPSPCTLDWILRKDMAKSGRWMDLRSDTEIVGIEMGEAIVEEVIEDTIWSCVNGRRGDWHSAVSADS